MCACMYTHTHVQQTCMAANRKETKEFQISVYFVQIKAKIIKYGFKHTECRLVYVYIMLINFIVDLEMTGMDEVMFRPPHPLKFSPKVLCCQIVFLGDSVLYKVCKIYKFFLHSDGPLQHNLSFCDFRFKYVANYCIMSNLTLWT